MLARQVSVPNRLLAALPRTDYRRLLPRLEPVKLAFGKTLYESHSQIQQVYFPNDCFVSMLTTVDADRAAEVGLIGSEGMIGVPMALGVAVSPFRAVVQGEGTAMRMTTADFRRNFSTSVALKREVFLFTHLLMIQIAQTAAPTTRGPSRDPSSPSSAAGAAGPSRGGGCRPRPCGTGSRTRCSGRRTTR